MKRCICLAALCLAWLLPAAALGGELVDDSGRRITFNKPFSRIISLYAAHGENLFSLGLDKEIVGVSKGLAYPPAAQNKPRYHYRDDAERFLAARPDLILIRPMIAKGYAHLVERLTRAGVTVVSLQPKGVDQLFDYWRKLGLLTGRVEQAESMIADFKEAVAGFARKASEVPADKQPGVYFESMHKKMKTFAPGAMAVFALTKAGGRNVAADAKGVRDSNIAYYGKEKILSKGDEIEVYLAQLGAMNKVTVSQIKKETGFSIIKAVKQGRVHLVPEEIVSRPTLRLLEGIRLIKSLLFPDRQKAEK